MGGVKDDRDEKKWQGCMSCRWEQRSREQLRKHFMRGEIYDVVYVPSEAMNEVFGKTVICDGGGGGEEGLPYYDFKYYASKPAWAANSSFCVSFLNAVYRFETKTVHSLKIRISISVLLARMGFFQHIKFVKRFVDAFKQDEAEVYI
jgi:hypothetical protein